MATNYNRISGQNLERLAALSDGIFAVAMTLLVLDLRVPVADAMQSQSGQVLNILVGLAPRFLAYFMSFLTLGIFWLAQQTQLNHFARVDRNLTWIHLFFLFAVSLMPFSTGLLAEYITDRITIMFYWLHLLLLGVMLFASVRYAGRAGLMEEENAEQLRAAQIRRIVLYQVLYAIAASLCLINTYVALVGLILLQLNSVLAPHIGPLDRV